MCCMSVRMHCVWTDEGKKKKKEKNRILIGWGCACRGAGIQMASLACGRGCVVCMQMSIKERKRKQRTHFVGGDGGCVGLWTRCMWTCWRADADAGGGRA